MSEAAKADLDIGEKARPKVRFIMLKNRLREKIRGGVRGPIAIDPKAFVAAEAAFSNAAEDYPDWVQKHLAELRQLYMRARGFAEERKRKFAAIRTIALEMKGQGTTFGYPLSTSFAASLYNACGPSAPPSDEMMELIKAHLDAIGAVIKDRVKGDGGEIGAALQAGLDAAIAKFSDQQVKPRPI
jgi:hypothetical protein